MIKIKDYVRVGSLEEAYELNQKRSACILGGMLWTKMGQRQVQTAIDLSGLGLDQIEESEEEFSIGCMVTLRQLEEHEGLNAYTDGAARESVRSIVGVQFRNLATVGGSIFGRFGFSDVLTLFLALDTEVELVHAGRMPLAEFACSKRDRDVLVRLIVKKHEGVTVYQSHRNSRTDFPVLTCAVRVEDGKGCAVLGARPAKAARVELPAELAEKLAAGKASAEELKAAASEISDQFTYGSNMRGSAEYRHHLGRVLLRVYRKPSYKNWLKALAEEGISLETELYRQREPEEVLPWSHIASSWPKERLLRDSERAREQRFKDVLLK